MPRKEVAPINLFDLFAKISLDTSEYDSGVKDVSKSGGSLASKLKNGLASAGKVAAAGIGAITAAAGAAVGGLLALESSTEEYRVAQGKLNTAFEAAGYGAETAQQATPFTAFWVIRIPPQKQANSWRSWQTAQRTCLLGRISLLVLPVHLATVSPSRD